MEILTISNLSKRFGSTQALEKVNLRFRSGTMYGLVGNNGAGKTTLFRILAGLVHPDAGTIQIFGETDIKSTCGQKARKRMGLSSVQRVFSSLYDRPHGKFIGIAKTPRLHRSSRKLLDSLIWWVWEPEKATRNKLCGSFGQFQRDAAIACNDAWFSRIARIG